jgi:hypothetical protein
MRLKKKTGGGEFTSPLAQFGQILAGVEVLL